MGAALSEFCHLGLFLVIFCISLCLFQVVLQLLNGFLIDLLCLASLNSRIRPLNECEQIGAPVDSRNRNLGLFCDRRNGDVLWLHPAPEHRLDRHSYLLEMLLSHLLARLDESVRMLVLWTIAVCGTHGPLLVRTFRQADQWLLNAATRAGVCLPTHRENDAAQEYQS